MEMISDNQLRTECFNVLVEHFGYLDTERFVIMMSRSPEDYTTWHRRHFSTDETVRELGKKIKEFTAARHRHARQYDSPVSNSSHLATP